LINEGYQNYSSPAIDRNGNIIFQTTTDDSGYINSVDYYGNLNWKTTLGDNYYDGAIIDHGLVCDAVGKIYCGSTSGLQTNFWCIDNDGKILWKLDLEGYEYNTSPAISSDGTIYIGTHLSSTFLNHVRNLIAVRDTVTQVENNNQEILSDKLEQNYPNPFNPSTVIRYSILSPSFVTLKIYDILGREVKTLVNQEQTSGMYVVNWNGSDIYGNKVSTGVYFYRIDAGNFSDVKKMLLIK